MINIILYCLLVLIVSIVIHEAGHKLVMRFYLGYWPQMKFEYGRIRIGTLSDYEKLTDKQKTIVYAMGVYLGALYIVISAITVPFVGLMLIPYIMASKKDIRNIMALKVK